MEIQESIPSKLEIVPEFVSRLLNKISNLHIGEDEIFDIRLSLEEALINAIKHGNKMDPNLYVEINIEVKEDSLVIKVKDQGGGFDLKKLTDPTEEKNIILPFGRGIFLIKKLMDKVEFFDGGSGIKMLKSFKKGG